MPNTPRGARSTYQCDPKLVPQPCRSLVVQYLKKVVRVQRKLAALRKLEWAKDNLFVPKKTMFRDGKNIVHQVIEEEAQRKVYSQTFDVKLKFVQQEIDTCKKESNDAFLIAKKALEDYKTSLAKVTADWIVGDHATDIYRAAVEQVLEASVNIQSRLKLQFQRWEERQKAKMVRTQTKVQNAKVVKEAFLEDEQKNKPLTEQISDLRLALKQVLSSSSHSHSHSQSHESKNGQHRRTGGGTRSASASCSHSAQSARSNHAKST